MCNVQCTMYIMIYIGRIDKFQAEKIKNDMARVAFVHCPINTVICCLRVLTLLIRQAGAVSKKKFDCFFLVYWVYLNYIHLILGGWFTRCLETSMHHI